VSDAVVLQYVGFENRGAVREYAFTVRGSGGTSTEYLVTIANEAFVARRVRYQDGLEICSLRLHREFAARADPSSLRAPFCHRCRTGRVHECPRPEAQAWHFWR